MGWLAWPLAVFTRADERAAVRPAVLRIPVARSPQTELLVPSRTAVLAQAGTAEDAVDLYVQRARVPDAYAAGGSSLELEQASTVERRVSPGTSLGRGAVRGGASGCFSAV